MKMITIKRLLTVICAAAFLFAGGMTGLVRVSAQQPTLRRPVRRRATPPLVPVGTNLKTRINETLSSKTARVGDKFTMTVMDPVRFNEATLHGHVSSIVKSGRVSGKTTMNLTFTSIMLSDGRSGPLRGYISRVYGANSKADNEGGVESGSRTKQAVKRGGIGAAAGAIVGGLAGGGKGAAIDLLVGGGGGVGSLAVQGRKELKIESGTEMLVHVTH